MTPSRQQPGWAVRGFTRAVARVPIAIVAVVVATAVGSSAATAAHRVRLSATIPSSVTAGDVVVVKGRVRPARRVFRAALQQKVGKRWRTRAKARLDRRGRFKLRLRVPAAIGTVRLRAAVLSHGRVKAAGPPRTVSFKHPNPPPPPPRPPPPPPPPLPPPERPPPPPPPPPTGDEDSLTLAAPPAAGAFVNTAQAVTATLLTAAGAPVAHTQVRFKVTGANALVRVLDTDAHGHAPLTYNGTHEGTDTVNAATADVSAAPVTAKWNAAPSGAPRPTVDVPSAPADGSLVSAPMAVRANVEPPSGHQIASWVVTAVPLNGGAGVPLGRGTGTPSGDLGTLDPTILANGPYQIAVTAATEQGAAATASSNVTITGRMKLGRVVQTYRDLSIPAIGFPLAVERTYDSTDKATGDFGVGWRLSVGNEHVAVSAVLGGPSWSPTASYGCGLFVACLDLAPSSARFVTVTHPSGRTEVFDFVGHVSGPILGPYTGTATFTPRPGTGTTSTLEATSGHETYTYELGGDTFTDPNTGQPYDPRRFKLTLHNGRVLVLDASSGLVSATDPNGNSLSIDDAGVHASDGQSIAFTRDAHHRITSITGPLGEQLTYTYDGNGDLAKLHDELGNDWTFAYDLEHGLTGVRGPRGPLRRLVYDADGRLTSLTDGEGNVTTFSANAAERTSVITDPLGQLVTTRHYDERGNLVELDRTHAGTTLTWTYTYDDAGRPLTGTDPNGHTTRATYDAGGALTSLQDAAHRTWTYGRNDAGHLTTTTGPGGHVADTRHYDADGNLTSVEHPDGSSDTFTYDGAGRPTSVTDVRGKVTTYHYDAAGRLDQITDPLGHITHAHFNAERRLESVTDPTGGVTSMTYDAAGRRASTTDPNGHTVHVAYDANGNQTGFTDALGHTAAATYDRADQLTSITDRMARKTAYAYDADGRLTEVTAPDDTTTYAYDGFGRLSDVGNAVAHLTYAVDGAGNVTSARTRPVGTSGLPDVTLHLHLDAADAVTSVDGPAGTIQYGYDADGRLASVTDPQNGSFTLGYDAAWRLTSLTRPNGVDDALSYDGDGRLLDRTATHGATTVARATYTHDAAGRRASLTDLDGVHTFTRDDAGRLLSADHPAVAGPDEAFAYDAAGNRTSGPQGGGPMHYDAADRLLDDAIYTYAYDDNGELVSRTVRSSGATTHFDWNSAGLLTAIRRPGGSSVHYAYDPLGRRVSEDAGGGNVTRSVYDGLNPIADLDGSNALSASYVDLPALDQVLEVSSNGTRAFPIQDGLGSVAAVTALNGSVSTRLSYDSFGGLRGAAASTDHRNAFTGRPYDAADGLYDLRAREYDPRTGRFLSEDPVLAVNPYAYAANDPIGRVDPLGAEGLVEEGMLDSRAGAEAPAEEAVGEAVAEEVAAEAEAVGEAEAGAAEEAPAFARSQYGRMGDSARRGAFERSPRCPYCNDAESTEVDHITSLKQDWESGGWADARAARTGRVNDPENLIGACKPCNASKGARPIGNGPGEWWPPGWGDVWWPFGGG